jgi:hypothetical protein
MRSMGYGPSDRPRPRSNQNFLYAVKPSRAVIMTGELLEVARRNAEAKRQRRRREQMGRAELGLHWVWGGAKWLAGHLRTLSSFTIVIGISTWVIQQILYATDPNLQRIAQIEQFNEAIGRSEGIIASPQSSEHQNLLIEDLLYHFESVEQMDFTDRQIDLNNPQGNSIHGGIAKNSYFNARTGAPVVFDDTAFDTMVHLRTVNGCVQMAGIESNAFISLNATTLNQAKFLGIVDTPRSRPCPFPPNYFVDSRLTGEIHISLTNSDTSTLRALAEFHLVDLSGASISIEPTASVLLNFVDLRNTRFRGASRYALVGDQICFDTTTRFIPLNEDDPDWNPPFENNLDVCNMFSMANLYEWCDLRLLHAMQSTLDEDNFGTWTRELINYGTVICGPYKEPMRTED